MGNIYYKSNTRTLIFIKNKFEGEYTCKKTLVIVTHPNIEPSTLNEK